MDVSAEFTLLGSQIRDARVAAGLTQTELSRISGVGLNAISLVERADRDVRISTILQLARALNCRLKFLPLSPAQKDEVALPQRAESAQGYDLDD